MFVVVGRKTRRPCSPGDDDSRRMVTRSVQGSQQQAMRPPTSPTRSTTGRSSVSQDALEIPRIGFGNWRQSGNVPERQDLRGYEARPGWYIQAGQRSRRIAETAPRMTESASYELEEGRGFALVAFKPSIADARWGEIEQVGTELKERLGTSDSPILLVDLTQLQFMGSSVVALIVKLWKATTELDGGMVVINTSNVIHEVLDIAGLTRLWTIVETREEAERVITKPPFRPPSMLPTYMLAVFGWVVAAGASGLIAALQKNLLTIDPTVARAIAIGCGALAAIAGLISSVRDTGVWRVLGGLLVFVAGTLVATGILL